MRAIRRGETRFVLTWAVVLVAALAAVGARRDDASKCSLLRPETPPPGRTRIDTTAIRGAPVLGDSALAAYRVVAAEGCCIPLGEDRLLVVAPAPEPRRLGDVPLVVLRPGDRLLLPRSSRLPSERIAAGRAQEALAAARDLALDRSFAPLVGPPPAGSAPLQDIGRATGGILEALGAFDYRDDRPSDGAASMRMLLRAGKAGSVEFELLQTYERSGPGIAVPEPGIETRRFAVRVRAADAPITVTLAGGDSTDSDTPLETLRLPAELGVHDLLVISLSLGYANRGGSEQRGPVGVRRLHARDATSP